MVGDNFDEIVMDESKDVLLEVSFIPSNKCVLPSIILHLKFCTFMGIILICAWNTDLCTMVWSLPSS